MRASFARAEKGHAPLAALLPEQCIGTGERLDLTAAEEALPVIVPAHPHPFAAPVIMFGKEDTFPAQAGDDPAGIVTSTIDFLNFYSWGRIDVEGMSVSLPTLAANAKQETVAA